MEKNLVIANIFCQSLGLRFIEVPVYLNGIMLSFCEYCNRNFRSHHHRHHHNHHLLLYQVSAGRHHRDQHRRMRFRACSFFHFFCRSNGNRWNRSLYNCWGIFALPSSFNSTTNVRFCDFREKKISVELQRTKEDREELDQQLKEAIHQKLLLSEQLEDWQVG